MEFWIFLPAVESLWVQPSLSSLIRLLIPTSTAISEWSCIIEISPLVAISWWWLNSSLSVISVIFIKWACLLLTCCHCRPKFVHFHMDGNFNTFVCLRISNLTDRRTFQFCNHDVYILVWMLWLGRRLTKSDCLMTWKRIFQQFPVIVKMQSMCKALDQNIWYMHDLWHMAQTNICIDGASEYDSEGSKFDPRHENVLLWWSICSYAGWSNISSSWDHANDLHNCPDIWLVLNSKFSLSSKFLLELFCYCNCMVWIWDHSKSFD